MKSIIEEVNFRLKRSGEDLAIAITQDNKTREVLMVAFMNREALEKTLTRGSMHYFSTSRRKIWHKGEESGHVQEVKEIRIDCDGDALLFLIEQTGAACHEGYFSCFFRRVDKNRWKMDRDKSFNPDNVYK